MNISQHHDARFEVFQYHNGSRELWITLPQCRHYPNYIAPADESTLALLTESKVAFNTIVQGRDFGYASPRRWLTAPAIVLLATGAVFLLWWAFKRNNDTSVLTMGEA